MKIGVTAVTGNLGEAVAETFIKKVGIENVVGFGRNLEKAKQLFKESTLKDLEIRHADYSKPETLIEAFKGITHLVVISVSNPPLQRVRQHRNVIDAAVQAKIQKLVYTSIVGRENDTGFQDVVLSNRLTEEDIKRSGIIYSISRNSLYLEPDLDFVQEYVKDNNNVANSAKDGKCSYTSRYELAEAYYHMLTEDDHNNKIYEIGGGGITQTELCKLINKHFDVNLSHKQIPVEEFTSARTKALGTYLGPIIGGIYESISKGYFNVPEDNFFKIVGRSHKSPEVLIEEYKNRGKVSRDHTS